MLATDPEKWEDDAFKLVLAKDVTLFGFEFWGRNPKSGNWEWVPEWARTNELPTLVHVGLGLGKTDKPGQPQDVSHRYIALPATAVPPDAQMSVGQGPPPQPPTQ